MTLNELINKYGLEHINSATKYPSILTYHALGQKGGMTNELCEGVGFPADAIVELTEKVDGTNSRMIIVGNDFLLGVREELVYAKGDRIKNSVIINPVLAGLDTFLTNTEELFFAGHGDENRVLVIFGESYGYKIQEGSKVYCSGSQKQSYRVFDIIQWTMDEFINIMESIPVASLSTWRDNGNQAFLNTNALAEFCKQNDIERTPIIATMQGMSIPVDAAETLEWMGKIIPVSKATLDSASREENQKFARPEGLVIRTQDRSFIRKLRFQDYQKGAARGWK